MKSKNILWIIILGVLLVGGIFAVVRFSNPQSIVGSTSIWTVEYGRLECQEDSQQTSIEKYADQNYFFTCGKDYLVDECKVYATCQGTPFIKRGCGGSGVLGLLVDSVSYNQLDEGTYHKLIATLKPGQSIQYTDKIRNAEYLKLEFEFNPYRLYTYESGGKFISSSSDCCLANQNTLQKNQFKAGDWECLGTSGTNQFKNYFLNWQQVSGAKVYRYDGQDVICRTNALYSLETQDLANGVQRIIQGNKIKNVECCPHQDNNCASDFEFVKVGKEETVECSYDYQCENAGNPFSASGTTYKIETCENGKCVEETKTAECLTDKTCRNLYGDNYGCDLSLDNYGKCVKIGQIEQEYCGNGVCDFGETFQNCPSDCSNLDEDVLECSWYQTYRPAKSFLFGAIKLPEKCKTSAWVYLAGLGGFLLLIIIVVVLIRRKK